VTKKHFDRIAEIFRKTNPEAFTMNAYAEAGGFIVWDAMMREFIILCEEFNSRFDRRRFIDACDRTRFRAACNDISRPEWRV
jgi:hypothetical protein